MSTTMQATQGMQAMPRPAGKVWPGQAILWAGLVLGTLDAANGVMAFYLKDGLNPVQVLQFIASGALGPAAFTGGLPSAGFGMVLHYTISFTVAAVYILAAQRLAALNRHPYVFGFLFGVAVYAVMNYLVLPLSAASPGAFSLPMFLNGILGHGLLVGLPAAFYARRVQ